MTNYHHANFAGVRIRAPVFFAQIWYSDYTMNVKKYYGKTGAYLNEHRQYFTPQQLKKESDFLISALRLKKNESILDVACGHGRHTIDLSRRGFNVHGLDFSSHLISIAKRDAQKQGVETEFFRQNIHDIKLKRKYQKAYLFFSEFGLFKAKKVFRNINRILARGGLFLLDIDHIFRLTRFLDQHPRSSYFFDPKELMLSEKKGRRTSLGVRYYFFPEIENLFHEAGFKMVDTFGDYKKNPLEIKSGRMISVGKKL